MLQNRFTAESSLSISYRHNQSEGMPQPLQLEKLFWTRVAENHPNLRSKIEEHIQKTRNYADLIKGCVERLGEKTSAIKAGFAQFSGRVQAVATGAFNDELVKNDISDYATEHFEIACYKALIEAARDAGESEIARICEQILSDEQEMARFLDSELPKAVREQMSKAMTVHR
ncbi:MAG: DUF892 family protein [Acidobacteria bacterium]|nr:DUF892 family protein [Acidobacteriota bacterium]